MFFETNEKPEFEQILADAKDSLVVVDFFATWCGPCRIMGPKFHKMSDEFPTGIFIKVDVDEAEDITSDYDIKVMPTFVFIKNGKVIHTLEGNNPDALRTTIAQNI
uniref:Thioredoxin n=2 Tax=Panagrolaimus sp. JU765 TaxID=591449 RepID=A0AC34RLJ8_9BILA